MASNGTVPVRRADESDARGIATVHVSTWQQAYRDVLPASYLRTLRVDPRERFWKRVIVATTASARPWVAEADGQIVGFVHAGPAKGNERAAEPQPPGSAIGEVYAIYVLPEYWDRGVGADLLEHAVADLTASSYAYAVLWVLEENKRARAFYERHGWRADGVATSDVLGGRHVREVRYRLVLDASASQADNRFE